MLPCNTQLVRSGMISCLFAVIIFKNEEKENVMLALLLGVYFLVALAFTLSYAIRYVRLNKLEGSDALMPLPTNRHIHPLA